MRSPRGGAPHRANLRMLVKKSLIWVIFLLGLGALAFVVLRNSHSSDGSEAGEEASLDELISAKKRIGTWPTTTAHSGQRVQFSPRFLREVAEASDPSHQQLAVAGPRDEKHEQELQSKLRDAFSGRAGVSVGEVACNAEFCRAEVYGSAETDIKQDAVTLMGAVDPKGLRYCLRAEKEISTGIGCYFGRNDSWIGPDPAKIQP
jgi:hypothetical protein